MADKIDMSLDDIIKLKRGSRGRGRGQRGRGGFVRGGRSRGGSRGRSRGGTRGASRGGSQGGSRGRGKWVNKSPLSFKRGQGRGSARSRGSSRNFRSLSRSSSVSKGVSPLNRTTDNQKPNFKKTLPQKVRGQGRRIGSARFPENKPPLRGSGRGSRFRGRGGRVGLRGRRGAMQQQQKQAIVALRKAKTTLSKINAQVRRNNFVNIKRGIPQQQKQQTDSFQRNPVRTSWSSRGRMRGRGRGRSFQNNKFIPSKLNRDASNSLLSLNSKSSQQSVRKFGSTTSLNTQTRGRKRPWRDNSIQRDSPKIMTISVSNSTGVQNNRSSNMRPHIGTQNFNFSSGIFAQGSTGVSLNDRFTSSEGSGSSVIISSGERKVFF